MTESKRIAIKQRPGIGYSTVTDIFIDGEFIGCHYVDHMLDSFYGGEVWRPNHKASIQLNPRWHDIFGHKACFLNDCIAAAKRIVSSLPATPERPA